MATQTRSQAPAKRQASYSTPVVKTSPTQMKAVFEQAMERLEAVLPRHLTPERVSQVVTTIMFRTPKLQECDSGSILASVIQASSLGLDLLPSLNEAFLIPRWNGKAQCNECQFQPGYMGLVKLARNSGQIATIQARLVRQGDKFAVRYTPDLDFYHEPILAATSPVTHVYAVAKLSNGESLIEVMSGEEIEAIHRRSEGFKNAAKYGKPEEGPWATDWNEMARKTVVKRLCKSLPRSLDLATAIDADDQQYRGDGGESVVVSRRPDPSLSRSANLAARLNPPEPEFSTSEGVASPLRSEDDEAGYIDDADPDRPDDFPADEPGAEG